MGFLSWYFVESKTYKLSVLERGSLLQMVEGSDGGMGGLVSATAPPIHKKTFVSSRMCDVEKQLSIYSQNSIL
jgi:hypothetical protein